MSTRCSGGGMARRLRTVRVAGRSAAPGTESHDHVRTTERRRPGRGPYPLSHIHPPTARQQAPGRPGRPIPSGGGRPDGARRHRRRRQRVRGHREARWRMSAEHQRQKPATGEDPLTAGLSTVTITVRPAKVSCPDTGTPRGDDQETWVLAFNAPRRRRDGVCPVERLRGSSRHPPPPAGLVEGAPQLSAS
jgi:hypothetical protein